jgi:hypothetical protein
LILPGKILTSDFPETKDNATGYNLDVKSDESLDAYIKLQSKPVVVTAELGGLVIDKPLDSKTLRRTNRHPADVKDSDIPITDAGPGFIAEAASVTSMTTYYFPGGEEYLKKSDRSFGYQQPGVTISAKLFAPKGREIESLSNVKIIKALDDKNREVEKFKNIQITEPEDGEDAMPDDQPDDEESSATYEGGRADKPGAIDFDLRLSLPKPDAESIAELSGEAVVKTSGSFKEMVLKDLKQGATNEVDISQLIPGAKMIVTKFVVKKNSFSLNAQITGPAAEVPKLKVTFKTDSKEHSNFNSNSSERSSKKTGDAVTRKISVNGYSFSEDNAGEPEVSVLVRFPQDQKRERVHFKLTGLDLL